MLTYTKTAADTKREASDIRNSPIMRFLKNQDHFKFNIGDILVRQTKYTGDWVTTVTPGVAAPKKFMYVFENELGIKG